MDCSTLLKETGRFSKNCIQADCGNTQATLSQNYGENFSMAFNFIFWMTLKNNNTCTQILLSCANTLTCQSFIWNYLHPWRPILCSIDRCGAWRISLQHMLEIGMGRKNIQWKLFWHLDAMGIIWNIWLIGTASRFTEKPKWCPHCTSCTAFHLKFPGRCHPCDLPMLQSVRPSKKSWSSQHGRSITAAGKLPERSRIPQIYLFQAQSNMSSSKLPPTDTQKFPLLNRFVHVDQKMIQTIAYVLLIVISLQNVLLLPLLHQ